MLMKPFVRELLPRPLWRRIAYVYWSVQDALAVISGRDTMLPSRRKLFIGSGDFRQIGDEFLRYFVDLGGLRPDHAVLDVGCGIGRMALPLTTYLGSNGRYEGFDLVADGVRWCQENITPRHPNFRFRRADIYNELYNPDGAVRAAEYAFPYPDGSFDFAFLTSVLTHMRTAEVDRYVLELARVLKPGGRCLMTFFLLNPQSKALMASRASSLCFAFELDGCFTADRRVPEEAIAYEEGAVRKLVADRGLRLVEPVHYGSWCGRKGGLSYQDICVVEKA